MGYNFSCVSGLLACAAISARAGPLSSWPRRHATPGPPRSCGGQSDASVLVADELDTDLARVSRTWRACQDPLPIRRGRTRCPTPMKKTIPQPTPDPASDTEALADLFARIRLIWQRSRQQAARSVNTAQVCAN